MPVTLLRSQAVTFVSIYTIPFCYLLFPVPVHTDSVTPGSDYTAAGMLPFSSASYLYGTVPVANGGTGQTSITDTTYTTARYRASSLHSTETTPTTNGVICWTYE